MTSPAPHEGHRDPWAWVGCPHWCPHCGSHMGVCMTCGCATSTVIGAPLTLFPRAPESAGPAVVKGDGR